MPDTLLCNCGQKAPRPARLCTTAPSCIPGCPGPGRHRGPSPLSTSRRRFQCAGHWRARMPSRAKPSPNHWPRAPRAVCIAPLPTIFASPRRARARASGRWCRLLPALGPHGRGLRGRAGHLLGVDPRRGPRGNAPLGRAGRRVFEAERRAPSRRRLVEVERLGREDPRGARRGGGAPCGRCGLRAVSEGPGPRAGACRAQGLRGVQRRALHGPEVPLLLRAFPGDGSQRVHAAFGGALRVVRVVHRRPRSSVLKHLLLRGRREQDLRRVREEEAEEGGDQREHQAGEAAAVEAVGRVDEAREDDGQQECQHAAAREVQPKLRWQPKAAVLLAGAEERDACGSRVGQAHDDLGEDA
mmetsp:Transcript_97415/g.252085  ORF Transcript_97415/g.252085 Transcript_97415/m.252085 type:complete len:356 (+) Transcript_97415:275-1342(+)